MEARWTNVVVLIFWLATMSWLVVAKVLPPLERGNPPDYASIYSEPGRSRWKVSWNEQEIGWSEHRVARLRFDATTIRTRVHLDTLPLGDLLPPLLRGQAKALEGTPMDTVGEIALDEFGRLSGFRSSVRLGDREMIALRGVMEDNQLQVRIEVGNQNPLLASIRLPADALVGDELSPQTRLPNLTLGQRWTVPVFNPLRPDAAAEILQATVPRDEWIFWNGQQVHARVVEYRADSGSSSGATAMPRSRLWVHPDGDVIRQEIRIGKVKLSFERLPNWRRPRPLESQPAGALP